jgi:DNA ligase-1
MIKRLDEKSVYEPAESTSDRRSLWVKLKKDYVDGLADSFDVVPIGAWRGSGRKGQWWSPVLLAVVDPETGNLQSLCRCMSGFDDKFYREMRSKYSAEQGNLLSHKPSNVETNDEPAVWFRQLEVWEVRGAELSLSRTHKAGGVKAGRGISLRFPRFLRTRPDKGVLQATSAAAIAALYDSQPKATHRDENDEDEDEDEEEEDEDEDAI